MRFWICKIDEYVIFSRKIHLDRDFTSILATQVEMTDYVGKWSIRFVLM